MTNEKRVHVRVKGRVQGVGFRWFTRETAESLGLSGWVKNLPDGSVEVEVEGGSDLIDEFVQKLQRGPSMARVRECLANEMPKSGLGDGFQIRD